MSALAVNHRWLFAVTVMTLLYGILLQDHLCESSDPNESSRLKNVLFITARNITDNSTFPTDVIIHNETGPKLCFNIPPRKVSTDCCSSGFDCTTKIRWEPDSYQLTLNATSLSNHDIVILMNHTNFSSCKPSEFYNSTGLFLHLDNCLKTGGKNIRLSQDGLCGTSEPYQRQICKGLNDSGETSYIIKHGEQPNKCISCKAPASPETTITYSPKQDLADTEASLNIMNDLPSILKSMGNFSSAAIKTKSVSGVIAKLPPENQTSMNFGFTDSGGVNILEEKRFFATEFSRTIQIPKEASEMAVKRNGSFAGVLLFPGMHPKDSKSAFFNDEIVGIEMGANISNLSHTIDIYYNMTQVGRNVSCRSWDGRGNQNWTTDGCETEETNTSITCRCSHLTFFAILMSSTPANISAFDYQTLTQITEIGCGVSAFFLGVALFMHFFIRKNKASNAAKILVNLLIAMFLLNLSFLVNKTIAGLKNPDGCLAIAASLHYSMLATFNWFSMQAVHLYVSLHKFSADIKHYMLKICITAWVTPAVAVVALLASRQYGNIVIHVDDGSSANMCWIPDSNIHLGFNISYYAIVFIFTFTIFVATVTQIAHFQSKAVKVHDSSSTKKKFFSILGLFCILGISWGFAFFSYGPLVTPSYYIFTILNSFQGFLLFIYYYYSTKIPPETRRVNENPYTTQTATENVYTASPQK